MMKHTEERDLIVMNAMRFELHFCSGRATSEKTYAPAFPHHRNTQRPGLWFTNCLDYTIGPAMATTSSWVGCSGIRWSLATPPIGKSVMSDVGTP